MNRAKETENVYDLIRDHMSLEDEVNAIDAKLAAMHARRIECRREQKRIAAAVAPAVQGKGPYFIRAGYDLFLVDAGAASEGGRLDIHKLHDAIDLYHVAPGETLAAHRDDDGTLRVIPAEAATA